MTVVVVLPGSVVGTEVATDTLLTAVVTAVVAVAIAVKEGGAVVNGTGVAVLSPQATSSKVFNSSPTRLRRPK
jgi:hypothetical protein